MGRGVCNSWREGQKFVGLGQEFQFNSWPIKRCDALQKATINPPFLLSPDTLCCNKLEQNGVPTCSLKVYKLAEIQGGDCCNNPKSHCLGVHVIL